MDLSDPGAYPYFLWDDPMTVAELKDRLRTALQHIQAMLLGRILREARDTEVWLFTTPQEVAARWNEIVKHLGRRRRFWQALLQAWRDEGLLAAR